VSLRGARSLKSFFEVKLVNKNEATRVGYKYALLDFEKFCKKLDPSRTLEEIR